LGRKAQRGELAAFVPVAAKPLEVQAKARMTAAVLNFFIICPVSVALLWKVIVAAAADCQLAKICPTKLVKVNQILHINP
jgi:hypothetical protein